MTSLAEQVTIVVGASRGIGRGVAEALTQAGAPVVTVSRTDGQAAGDPSKVIHAEVADARDDGLPARLIEQYNPTNIVIVAGVVPHMSSLQQQSWETFSLAWETDVRITFSWVREALLRPLQSGGKVIVFSSGAALGGSPLSGGYAGAKATQRFVTDYARWESDKANLGIAFSSIMSKFSPETGVGKSAVAAYSAEAGMSVEEFLSKQGPLLSPEGAGAAVVDLLERKAADIAPSYLLNGAGLRAL
ncbi:SDR family oxidoreductase [Jatrophihabitans sp.]|uniref:SDR family oxidoreductase n=1 Tax=Jatrophihabitans sp. TaxID=1932789 RepID=UPI002EFB2786